MNTLIFLAMSALVSSCATIESETTEHEATLTETVRVGESITIPLPANPTNGYCWNVYKKPSYCSVDIKASPPTDRERIDSAYVEYITITGKKAGEEVIELRYSRPRELPPIDPNDNCTIRVTVSD